MVTIGITGGVGAGKSTVINYLRDKYNAEVLIADDIAHILEEPGEACYNELVRALGEDILDGNGYIDSKKLAGMIFRDNSILKQVNSIVHPAVKRYILDRIESTRREGCEVLILEAALLIEDGYEKILDIIWYVYADEEVRRQRLKSSRGYSDMKIDSMFETQMKDAEYRKHCRVVIDNSGDEKETHSAIDRIVNANWGLM